MKALAGNVHNGLRIVYTEDEPLELDGVCNGTNPQTGITFLCPQTSQTKRLDYPRLIGVDTSGCIFEFEWYTELACIETETHVPTPCAVQEPTSGFVLSFLSLEGSTRVLLGELVGCTMDISSFIIFPDFCTFTKRICLRQGSNLQPWAY